MVDTETTLALANGPGKRREMNAQQEPPYEARKS